MNLKKILISALAAAVAVPVMSAASFAAEDTSAWQVAACAYDDSWDGWDFVTAEAGTLTLETTVGALREKGSISEENLGGVAVQVWGGAVGAKVEYTVTIGTAVSDSGTASFEQGSGNTAAIVGQYSTELTGGTYEFDDSDSVVVTVAAVEGDTDDEPSTGDEPATGDEPTTDDEPTTGDEPTTDDSSTTDKEPETSGDVNNESGSGTTADPDKTPATGVILLAAPAIAAAAGIALFRKRS